jgi:hypothetical protein
MKRVLVLLTVMAVTLVVASGVAWAVNIVGTNGPDTLTGTNGDDNLVGIGGDDVLFSLDGRDHLLGGPGKDFVFGGDELDRLLGGDKKLVGGPDNDIVVGGSGSDGVLGNAGNDFLIDGPDEEFSLDKLSGGNGDDVFLVQNVPAAKDMVTCGGGFDRVLADSEDVVAPNCEEVRIVQGTLEEVLEQEEEFFASIPPSFFEGLPPPPFP